MAEKLATFKIDEATWQRFKEKSGNASATLKRMIELYLSDRLNLDSGDVSSEVEQIWEVLHQMEERLGKLSPC